MKKIVIVVFVLMTFLLISNDKEEEILIPKDAIRFRIIANSNNFKDQQEKIQIKQELEPIFKDILINSHSKEETKLEINNNMNNIKKTVNGHNIPYKINYGNNYFPEKSYRGVTYPEGNYESLVISLGDGLGENWWCVLFPPLCLLEAKEESYDDNTYSFYIKEVIDKYF